MTVAKLFQTGRSQAVRLPKAFRFEGQEVVIKRVSNGVLLVPSSPEGQRAFWEGWYAALPKVEVPISRADLPTQERDWEL